MFIADMKKLHQSDISQDCATLPATIPTDSHSPLTPTAQPYSEAVEHSVSIPSNTPVRVMVTAFCIT